MTPMNRTPFIFEWVVLIKHMINSIMKNCTIGIVHPICWSEKMKDWTERTLFCYPPCPFHTFHSFFNRIHIISGGSLTSSHIHVVLRKPLLLLTTAQVQTILRANQPILDDFENSLKQSGISEQTIKTHAYNFLYFVRYLFSYAYSLRRLDETTEECL